MKLFVKIFIFISIINLLQGCLTFTRIKDPVDKQEIQSQGIIALGLFMFDPDDKSFLSKNNGIMNPVEEINLFAVNLVDDKKKLVTKGEFPNRDIEVKKQGIKKIVFASHMKTGPWFIFRTNDPKAKYAISEITYRIKCGDNCGKVITFALPSYYSQKTLLLSSPAGKVTFAGIYKMKKVILKDGGFFDANEESGFTLEDGADIILKKDTNERSRIYFKDEDQTMKGTEINFLKTFIKKQESGYWVEKANLRLKKLQDSEKLMN